MKEKLYKENVILHNTATAPGTGEAMYVVNSTIACLQISGTATDYIVEFEASLDGVNFGAFYGNYQLEGFYNIGEVNEKMVGRNSLYFFDIRPVKYLRAKITSITGGNLSIIGFDSI